MDPDPNRPREQPVEAQRDAALGTEPMAGALLPVGGPGNDPDADKLGDDGAEVDPRAPGERDAGDRLIPAAGAGSGSAPQLEATVLEETYRGEPGRDYTDDVRE